MSAVIKPADPIPLDDYPLAVAYGWHSPVEDSAPERARQLEIALRPYTRTGRVPSIYLDSPRRRRFAEQYVALSRGPGGKVMRGSFKRLCSEFGVSYNVGKYLAMLSCAGGAAGRLGLLGHRSVRLRRQPTV